MREISEIIGSMMKNHNEVRREGAAFLKEELKRCEEQIAALDDASNYKAYLQLKKKEKLNKES